MRRTVSRSDDFFVNCFTISRDRSADAAAGSGAGALGLGALVVVRIGLSDSSSIDVPRDRRTPHAEGTLVGCSMSKRMMGEGGEAGAPWRSAPADTRSSVSHPDCS